MVYFVDDMNMALVDKYDTQSAIEIMRQSIDYRGWFEKSKIFLKARNVPEPSHDTARLHASEFTMPALLSSTSSSVQPILRILQWFTAGGTERAVLCMHEPDGGQLQHHATHAAPLRDVRRSDAVSRHHEVQLHSHVQVDTPRTNFAVHEHRL